MYMLKRLTGILSAAKERVLSVGSPWGQSSAMNERIPLISDDQGYLDTENTRGGGDLSRQQQQQHELRGLSAEYVNWFESTTAAKYAVGNFVAYLLVAVVGYSFVFEDWAVHDSVYFAMVVFTTVGYGDLSPSSSASRVFTVFFALYGIIILGIFLGVVGESIIENHEETMKKRLSKARIRILQQLGTDDTTIPPQQRSLMKIILGIFLAEIPVLLVLVALGAPIFLLEDWDMDKGIYWMVVTGTTIGFGDLEPTKTVTRILCIFWIPLAVAVTGGFLGRIAGAFIDQNNNIEEERFLQRAMTLADIQAMDYNCDSRVSPDEFLRYMLVALQKVEKEDIDEIMAVFEKLDRGKSGYIEKEDLRSGLNGPTGRGTHTGAS